MVSRQQPWIFEDLFNELDSVFNGAFGLRAVQPADITVEGQTAIVRLDLPGVDAADVDVKLEDGELAVCAERKPDQADAEGLVAQERRMGVIERSVRLPWAVDQSAVEADLTHGVLTIRLKKAPELEPRQINVQSNN